MGERPVVTGTPGTRGPRTGRRAGAAAA